MMGRYTRSSRLTRTNEKQNKRQAILFTIAIFATIVILVQFGPLLINVFGNVVYTLRGGDKADLQIVGNAILQPPILVDVPEATQSSHINFGGIAPSANGTVEIYVNDELTDEITLQNEKFEAKEIPLKKGKNTIKARYAQEEKTSPFSEEYEVSQLSDKPKLEVSFPNDGQSFTKADKSINISGKTDPENTVTVNSFRAIVEPNGEFSYLLQLNDGENQITIEAQNQAGIASQKQLKVNYNP